MSADYDIIQIAQELTSQTIPVVVIQQGIKVPKPNPHAEPRADGTRPMWVIDVYDGARPAGIGPFGHAPFPKTTSQGRDSAEEVS